MSAGSAYRCKQQDGVLQSRGTPQGAAISPTLANLFLHYAFDIWVSKVLPSVRFCRYADDGVVHCKSKAQAERVLRRIGERLRQCGLELHPDRGSPYASAQHRQMLIRYGLSASMSRKGNCRDNAVMERFFLKLKMERPWQRRYANPLEVARNIDHDIVGFYNTRRLHSALNYQVPVTFENNPSIR